MSEVVKYNVGSVRSLAAKAHPASAVVAVTSAGAQALMIFASLMTFVVDNHAMPYGIALTHWITGAIMGLATLLYVMGKDTMVDGEFSVKATALYNELSPTQQASAKPIIDKIYELESKHPKPSLEMQNALLKRVAIIEKMVDAENYAEEQKVLADKSDTFTAVSWLQMVPQRPALEAGPSAKVEQPDHDEYGFPNYGKYADQPLRRAKRMQGRKVYEGEVF